MFRSFIVSEMALKWSLLNSMLLVPVTVPLVYSVIALVEGRRIEGLLRVVLQHLLDDLGHRVLAEVVQLAGVGNGVSILVDGQGALGDGEVGHRHGAGFGQGRAGSGHVGIDVPVIGVTLALALPGGVLDVAELAVLDGGLEGEAEHLAQLVGVHIATKRVGDPDLSSHDYFLSDRVSAASNSRAGAAPASRR